MTCYKEVPLITYLSKRGPLLPCLSKENLSAMFVKKRPPYSV